MRHWDQTHWHLPYLSSMGQNADDLKISKRVADSCFRAMFNNPSDLLSQRMHSYLQGKGGFYRLFAYSQKTNGKPDLSSVKEWEIKGTDTINISDDGVQRVFIRIAQGTDNWQIKRPRDADVSATVIVDGIMIKKPKFNLTEKYPGAFEKEFKIPVHSYHSSSNKTHHLTVNW